MDITPELLRQAMGCRRERAELFGRALDDACDAYGLASPRVLAAFLAQLGHESGSLEHVREVWGPTDAQRRYERDFTAPWPEGETQAWQSAFTRNRLAWRLGNTEAGDGRRYCGHGPLQVTGRYNHRRTTQRLRQRFGADAVPDFEAEPELLELPRWGALAACDYWRDKGLNALAETGSEADFEAITRAINGGLNGWADRLHRWARAKTALNAALDLPVLTEPAALAPLPVAAEPPPAPSPTVAPVPPPSTAEPAPADTSTDPQAAYQAAYQALENATAGDPAEYPQEHPPMAPILLGALKFGGSLVGALAQNLAAGFAPLAQEKLAKELARHTGSPQVAEQVATAMIETVQAATGKADPIEAVAAAKANPAVMQQAQDSALDTLDRLAPLLDKIAQWDQAAWAAEEASRSAARQHNDGEQLLFDSPWLKLKFLHLLSLAFVSFSGWFVTTNWRDLTPELRGAVITLMVIAGWNGVRDYWMGSSRSSSAKDAVIGELSRRK